MQTKIERLEAQLEQTPEGPERVDLLHALAWQLWGNDPVRASALAEEEKALAEKLDYPRGKAFALFNEGIGRGLRMQDMETAISCFMAAQEWFEAHDEIFGQARVKGILGTIYWGFGDFERGFEYSTESLELYDQIGDTDGKAWTLNAIGRHHYDVGDYDQALTYFKQACKLFSEIDEPMGRARALNGIGTVFHQTGRHEEGLEYQTQSLQLHREVHDKLGESRTLNDIGLMFQALEDYETALEYHTKSLKLREALEYHPGITTTLLDIGFVHIQLKQYDKALTYLHRSLSINRQLKTNPKAARAHRLIAEAYKGLGDFEQALDHHESYADLQTEISREDAKSRLANMQTVYQAEASKKESEIYRLRNVELKDKNTQLEQMLNKLNATQAQIIQEGKMSALGQLIAGLAHELNSPVGVLKSAGDVTHRGIDKIVAMIEDSSINMDCPKSREIVRTLRLLQQTAENHNHATERMTSIINSLTSFIRLDESDYQQLDIHEGLDTTLTLLDHEMRDRITVHRHYGDVPEIYGYPAQLNQVFMNLLINAIQAIPDTGEITIRTEADDQWLTLTISDTGKGIGPELRDRLFEPGFVSTGPRVRMRSGLYTSYAVIRKHSGDIDVTSDIGKGTTFTLKLPIYPATSILPETMLTEAATAGGGG